jgi:phosphoribosylformylglycinamidine (FGAM) synthase-like enzyme
VLKLVRSGLAACAHDCSKGGLAVALAEMAIAGQTGFKVDLSAVPNSCKALDELMFSESHSRYVIGTKEPEEVRRILPSEGVAFAEIGKTASSIKFVQGKKTIRLTLKQLQTSYESLEKTMQS